MIALVMVVRHEVGNRVPKRRLDRPAYAVLCGMARRNSARSEAPRRSRSSEHGAPWLRHHIGRGIVHSYVVGYQLRELNERPAQPRTVPNNGGLKCTTVTAKASRETTTTY